MNNKLISLMSVQLLRVVRLVRAIEAIQIAKGRWGLVVHGRGFTRLLADDPLAAPNLIRPAADYLPQVRAFDSEFAALSTAGSLGFSRLIRR